MSVDQCTKASNTRQTHETFEELDVPEKYRSVVLNLLKANAELFAQND